MSDNTLPRLMAAAKEFNIGKETLVEYLAGKGFSQDDLKPSSKLTEDMYRALQDEFKSDKLAKAKSDQIDLPKGANIVEAKRKAEADDSIKFEEKTLASGVVEVSIVIDDHTDEPAPVVPEAPKEAPKVEAPKEEEVESDVVKIEAPELTGPKIINKIDLSAIDSSTRPKKGAKKKEEEPPAEEPVAKKGKAKAAPEKEKEKVAEKPVEPAVTPEPKAEPEEEADYLKIEAEKLTGPKILGKIELPTKPESKDTSKEKRKRKRIVVDRKDETTSGGAARPATPGARPGDRGPSGIARFQQNDRKKGGRPDQRRGAPISKEQKEIDEKAIQDKIRETQAKISGTSKSGRSQRAKARRQKRDEADTHETDETIDNVLQLTEFISVSELANLMDVSFADVISKCMGLGIMVSINQRLDAEVIELVASEFGYEVEFIDMEAQAELEEEEDIDNEEENEPRPPIVTIMGHVDHGKTSLLDYIRNANVIAGEAGGITQHIGAYEVSLPSGKKIAFLDTPGHEAFTAMRARGAKVTDIAVIVVAADDAVMPQTKEAISHAQAAGVPMIFAINKVDKEGSNPEKIREQLSGMNILVEEWGGKYQSQELSAKKGLNVDLLLEKILLEAELLDLKANHNREAKGTIIEASLDKGRGYVATMLVQNGTLNIGDILVSGQYYGRVKAMFNERNQRVEKAPPSTPVLILGLNGAPQAGEKFKVYTEESEAKEIANHRAQILREQGIRTRKHITLDEIGRRLALGNFKELNLIIKGDFDGSVEALSDSLQKLSTEEIAVRIVHKGVGQITESDILLASASDAIIIGFQVRPSLQAAKLADNENIEIKTYSIIYKAIEEIKSAMEGMLEPTLQEKVLSHVEIREVYKFDKATVAGCFVIDGKIARNHKVRLLRDGIILHTGELGSLKRYKDDVKEVATNMECGLSFKNYSDLKVGDMIESFEEVEVKRKLEK